MRHFLGAHAVSCEVWGCPEAAKETHTSVHFVVQPSFEREVGFRYFNQRSSYIALSYLRIFTNS